MKAFQPISNGLFQSTTRRTALSRPAAISIRPSNYQRRQNRTFVSNPFTQNQTLTAQRTLRYPSQTIYEIISDVASYSHFVPYCQKSIVTRFSSPSPIDGKRYPEEATLVIGVNDSIAEEFTSRVYCVPGKIVEAVSGNTSSTLSGDQIAHHSPRPANKEDDPSRKDTVMAHLLTRWTLRPYPYKPPPTSATQPETAHKNHEETSELPGQEKTEVNLAIEFQFANPLYAALSSAAAPKDAEKMIEAFENRVKAVLEGPAYAQGKKARMEGVLRSKS